MAEWNNSKIFGNNYTPDIENVRLDLYRLLNQFLASKVVSKLCKKDGELNHAMYTLDGFFEVEATRILLSSSVIARVVDDQDFQLKGYNTTCGLLIPDLNKPAEKIDLELREACNKIIHAKSIHYDVEVGVQGYDQRLFNPYIYYYGNKRNKEWKATLYVIDYIKIYTDSIVQ